MKQVLFWPLSTALSNVPQYPFNIAFSCWHCAFKNCAGMKTYKPLGILLKGEPGYLFIRQSLSAFIGIEHNIQIREHFHSNDKIDDLPVCDRYQASQYTTSIANT